VDETATLDLHMAGAGARYGSFAGLRDQVGRRPVADRTEELLEAFHGAASSGDHGSLVRALLLWFGDRPLRTITQPDSLPALIDRDMARLDALIAAQVDAILHHPRFQRLEASWRGVAYLASHVDPDDGEVELRVIHWPWQDLCRDLERALEFDQSQLFTKVYTEELDMPGGKPFGVLIGDYTVCHRLDPRKEDDFDDVTTLSKSAEIAAAAFCPLIVGCRPSMFGLESFAELALPSDPASAFNPLGDLDNSRWEQFRTKDEARFIGVVLPRILMRLPYGSNGAATGRLHFREQVEGTGSERYLWGNAVYAFAAVLIRAFQTSGWFADIRGVRRDDLGGGLVTDLPLPAFQTDPDGIALKYSTDVGLTERRAADLVELGFIPLVKNKDTGYSWFLSCPSIQRPGQYESRHRDANVNARMSSMLHYVFCASRFGHYIKQIVRNRRVGSQATANEIRKYLSDKFLFNYRESNENASTVRKAEAPLRDYEVEIHQIPGRPGTYSCTVYLQPHYQFDYVEARIRLDTELKMPDV
jgi:type VI secretion system protein ImpD